MSDVDEEGSQVQTHSWLPGRFQGSLGEDGREEIALDLRVSGLLLTVDFCTMHLKACCRQVPGPRGKAAVVLPNGRDLPMALSST